MNSPLWTSYEIVKAVGGRLEAEFEVSGVQFNSRDVRPGDLFIALEGSVSDGHDYVLDAFEAGAAGAIVSRLENELAEWHQVMVLVEDTTTALEKLGIAGRNRMKGPVIGVTGSAGKTGTKEALRRALGRGAFVHASASSFNNHVGVPISLARMPAKAEIGIFELGMNHAGEISALSKMVRPDIAIITAIGAAHHAAFDSLEAIADAKAEILDGMTAKGALILPEDINCARTILAAAGRAGIKNIIQTSRQGEGADVSVKRLALHADCSCMSVDVMGDLLTFKVGIAGRHWVSNSLNIMAAVKAVGGDLGMAGLALGEMRPIAGRGAIHKINIDDVIFTLIDDSYNANPLSMAASIDVLGNISLEKRMAARIAVLGDMEELGGDALSIHLGLAENLAQAGVTKLFAYGPLMAQLAHAIHPKIRTQAFDCKSALVDGLVRQLGPGDVVLVKGSNEQKLGDIVAQLTAMHEIDEDEYDHLRTRAAE
jgi:UDP-N-acetylmuramoyl-tripeptide--D-alanyl-D-alanine ligase